MGKFLLIILSLFCSLKIFASNRNFVIDADKDYSTFTTDVNEIIQEKLKENISYYSLSKQKRGLDSTSLSSAHISTAYSANRHEGDFICPSGKSAYEWNLSGWGIQDLGSYGMLVGFAQYARGKVRDISWSAMRYPELYLPYAITDSTGGDSQFETYKILGGYAIKLKNWHVGADVFFCGDQAYRLTDPRSLNNTTFFSFGLGSSYIFRNQNSISLHAKYMRNKQFEHNRYWRPGEQQRFFVLYGFGLYDTKESIVAFGVQRMYYIHDFDFQLFYQSSLKKKAKATVGLNYDYNYLYTEESDYINLYECNTTQIAPFIALAYDLSESVSFKFFNDTKLLHKKGSENIFERVVTDVANSIYDYQKIAQESNYRLSTTDLNFRVQADWKINKKNSTALQIGTFFFDRKEKNVKYDFSIKNTNIIPFIRASYTHSYGKRGNEISICGQIGKQFSLKHHYDVDIKTSSIEHLDFQTAFAPYAYYAAEFKKWAISLCHIYKLNKCGIGLKINILREKGERLDDVEYTKSIGFNSVCPMISPQQDVHNKWYGMTSLFVTF